MPTSSTEICNIALRKLREQPIASLTEDSEPARLCNEFYADARDYLLAKYPHNFAMQRQNLSKLASAPTFEWSYQYALPTDPYCLRAYKLWANGAFRKEGWQVEAYSGARVIVTNHDTTAAAPVALLYIARVTDVSIYSPSFVETFADYLATQLAYPLTRDKDLTERRMDIFMRSWKEHRMADGGEGFYDDEFEDGVFVSVRN